MEGITPIDISKVRAHLAAKYKLTEDKIDFLLNGLKGSLQAEMSKAQTAASQNDLPSLAHAAHSMKGALLNLGLAEWAELARSIELGAKASDTIDFNNLVNELINGVAILIDSTADK